MRVLVVEDDVKLADLLVPDIERRVLCGGCCIRWAGS